MAAPLLASPATVEVNGIRFTGSWSRPVPGDEEIWGEYYYRIIAENIGRNDQTLLLGDRDKIRSDGYNGIVTQTSDPEREYKGDKYYKPVLGDLRPLTLKPGERSIIAHGSIFLDPNMNAPVYTNRRSIVYTFAVGEEMKQFYDVWIGEAELRFPLVPGRSDRKDDGKQDPTASGGPIPWKRESGWLK